MKRRAISPLSKSISSGSITSIRPVYWKAVSSGGTSPRESRRKCLPAPPRISPQRAVSCCSVWIFCMSSMTRISHSPQDAGSEESGSAALKNNVLLLEVSALASIVFPKPQGALTKRTRPFSRTSLNRRAMLSFTTIFSAMAIPLPPLEKPRFSDIFCNINFNSFCTGCKSFQSMRPHVKNPEYVRYHAAKVTFRDKTKAPTEDL